MADFFFALLLLFIFVLNFFLFLSFLGFFWSSSAGAPYVPTKMKIARQMVELAKIQTGDKVFDLGCGDGRIVFLAAEKGANATGVEISLPIYFWAKFKQKIHKKPGRIIHGSMWKIDLSNADVIFTYLFPEMMQRFFSDIYPKLKKGCRIVSHGFALKDLTPVQTWQPENEKRGKIMIYVKQDGSRQ